MVVNNKGFVFFYTLMLGILCIVLGLALASPTKSIVDNQRVEMGCSSATDNYIEATCYGMDALKFMIPVGLIVLGICLIGATKWIT